MRSPTKLKEEANGTPKVTLSLAEGDPAAVTISEWLVSFGGNPLILNDEGSVEAFTFLQNLWKDNLLARESLLGKFDTEVDYLQGETSWLAQNWPVTSAQLNEQGLLEKFDVYEGWEGPERAAHVIGGDVLGIPRGVSEDEKEAALALADFLISEDAQKTLVEKQCLAVGTGRRLQRRPGGAEGHLRGHPGCPGGRMVPSERGVLAERIGADERCGQAHRGRRCAVKATLDELHGKIEAAAKAAGAEYPPAEDGDSGNGAAGISPSPGTTPEGSPTASAAPATSPTSCTARSRQQQSGRGGNPARR